MVSTGGESLGIRIHNTLLKLICIGGATLGVRVSMSAFPACPCLPCYRAGLYFSCSLNIWTLTHPIFRNSVRGFACILWFPSPPSSANGAASVIIKLNIDTILTLSTFVAEVSLVPSGTRHSACDWRPMCCT